jgi:tRNA modification GTPase
METIVALATPPMNCAIHIIRLSGKDVFDIINKITKSEVKKIGNIIQYNYIIDENKKIIDEVLLNTFVEPKSFTGENSVEINCHGGVLVANKIIKLLVINGARHANRGEFSQRAMINKKINYSQVEAINNLIHSKNEISANIAINEVLGEYSKDIKKIRDGIFQLIGSIEVNIDYPEYDDVDVIDSNLLVAELTKINLIISQILKKSKIFMPIYNGINIAIIGKPNVGKSSLLNLLFGKEKAIVSNIPGTTRDIVEASINIDSITCNFLDTAGLRVTDDLIEFMGIEKSKDAIEKAEIIIHLKDPSDNIEYDFKNLLDNKKVIEVYNKSDILKIKDTLSISVKNKDINQLIDKIKEIIQIDELIDIDVAILQSDRQIVLLEKIYKIINETIDDSKNNIPIDMLLTNLEIIIKNFNKILSIDLEYDKMNELFSKFCLGK